VQVLFGPDAAIQRPRAYRAVPGELMAGLDIGLADEVVGPRPPSLSTTTAGRAGSTSYERAGARQWLTPESWSPRNDRATRGSDFHPTSGRARSMPDCQMGISTVTRCGMEQGRVVLLGDTVTR
jgi:hypothetical protein